jgi:nucleoside-diphosphate-sugar epimerase
MPTLLRGRAVKVLGDPDTLHSWTYVLDVARALVRVGADERAWGSAWHVPTAPPASARDTVALMCRIAGIEPVKVTGLPWLPITVLGTFLPLLGELREVRHQFDRPCGGDTSRVTAVFGDEPTPIEDSLAATVAWWRDHERQARMANTATS